MLWKQLGSLKKTRDKLDKEKTCRTSAVDFALRVDAFHRATLLR
jgi:hypothetical protein